MVNRSPDDKTSFADLTFVLGSCQECLSYYLDNANSGRLDTSLRSVMIGQEPCDRNVHAMLDLRFSNATNLRPVRFWMLYPRMEAADGVLHYFAYGGVFLNRATDPRIVELGKI